MFWGLTIGSDLWEITPGSAWGDHMWLKLDGLMKGKNLTHCTILQSLVSSLVLWKLHKVSRRTLFKASMNSGEETNHKSSISWINIKVVPNFPRDFQRFFSFNFYNSLKRTEIEGEIIFLPIYFIWWRNWELHWINKTVEKQWVNCKTLMPGLGPKSMFLTFVYNCRTMYLGMLDWIKCSSFDTTQ